MSRPHAKLYGVKKKLNVGDDAFKAILLGETGSESAKGISWKAVEACVTKMELHYGSKEEAEPKKDSDWRELAKSPHARKIYVLWGILKRNKIVEARFPDGFVKRMSGRERAEWLTSVQANPIIEALIDWIKREGLASELR